MEVDAALSILMECDDQFNYRPSNGKNYPDEIKITKSKLILSPDLWYAISRPQYVDISIGSDGVMKIQHGSSLSKFKCSQTRVFLENYYPIKT